MKTKKDTVKRIRTVGDVRDEKRRRDARAEAKERKAVKPSHGAKKDDGRCPDCANPKCRITARIAELDGTETIVRYHGDAPDLRKRKVFYCATCFLMRVDTDGAICPGCGLKAKEREEGARKREENQRQFAELIRERKARGEVAPRKSGGASAFRQPTAWVRAFCKGGTQTEATLRKAMLAEGYAERTIKKQVTRAANNGLFKK